MRFANSTLPGMLAAMLIATSIANGSMQPANAATLKPYARCKPQMPAIGGVESHLFRESDDACIGRMNWPVVPQPSASLELYERWCGSRSCGQIKAESAPFRYGTIPGSFVSGRRIILDQGQGKRVILPTGRGEQVTFRQNRQKEGTFFIESGGSSVLAYSLSATRKADTRDANENPQSNGPEKGNVIKAGGGTSQPVGVFAFVPDLKLDALSGQGDTMCLSSPSVFRADGLILMKRHGVAINNNPYQITHYMECLEDSGGNATCTIHASQPGTPNPIASMKPFIYEPLADGHYRACEQGTGKCQVLYACIRPGGPVNETTMAAEGVPLIRQMLADSDGGSPGFHYDAGNQLVIETEAN